MQNSNNIPLPPGGSSPQQQRPQFQQRPPPPQSPQQRQQPLNIPFNQQAPIPPGSSVETTHSASPRSPVPVPVMNYEHVQHVPMHSSSPFPVQPETKVPPLSQPPPPGAIPIPSPLPRPQQQHQQPQNVQQINPNLPISGVKIPQQQQQPQKSQQTNPNPHMPRDAMSSPPTQNIFPLKSSNPQQHQQQQQQQFAPTNTFRAPPPQPFASATSKKSYGSNLNVHTLYFPPVGHFSDMGSNVPGLPGVTVTAMDQSPYFRLTALKNKVNELQDKRVRYHYHLGGAAVLGVVATPFTGGGSLIASSAGNVHQRNRISKIKTAIVETLHQINQIRCSFGYLPRWAIVEQTVRINEKVFKGGIERNELKGDL